MRVGAKYVQPKQEIKSMIINILQNLSHRYSSHNSNIKCIGTIKRVDSKLVHYVINLNVVSSSDF